MKVMMLAAGLGTRLRPFTDILPKPALPLLNIPLIAYPFEVLRSLDPTHIVINTHHLAQEMEATVLELTQWNCLTHFSHESPEILGSAGGILKARAHLEGDGYFAVANGDEVFLPRDPDILKRAAQYHQLQINRAKGSNQYPIATLVVTKNELVGTQFGGIWCDSTMRVIGIGKTPPRGGLVGYHFTGFQILSDEVFDLIPISGASNIFYDVFNPNFSRDIFVQAVVDEGVWLEVGNIQNFLEASRTLLELYGAQIETEQNNYAGERIGQILTTYRRSLDQWVHEIDGAQFLKAKSSQISKGVRLRGSIVIGENVLVPTGCTLEDVVICSNAHLTRGQTYARTIVI